MMKFFLEYADTSFQSQLQYLFGLGKILAQKALYRDDAESKLQVILAQSSKAQRMSSHAEDQLGLFNQSHAHVIEQLDNAQLYHHQLLEQFHANHIDMETITRQIDTCKTCCDILQQSHNSALGLISHNMPLNGGIRFDLIAIRERIRLLIKVVDSDLLKSNDLWITLTKDIGKKAHYLYQVQHKNKARKYINKFLNQFLFDIYLVQLAIEKEKNNLEESLAEKLRGECIIRDELLNQEMLIDTLSIENKFYMEVICVICDQHHFYDNSSYDFKELIAIQRQLIANLSQDCCQLAQDFSYRYLRVKHHIESINNIQQRKLYTSLVNISRPITIQDVIITHSVLSNDCSLQYDPIEVESEQFSQLVEHVRLIINTARETHVKHFEEMGKSIHESNNHITRVITDEFSFYSRAPLTIDSYIKLIEQIRDISSTLPVNIHLVLATFPVVDVDNRLHNIAVFVTTGEKVAIHHRSKSRPSLSDPHYGYSLAFNQSDYSEFNMTEIVPFQPIAFGFGSIVLSTTQGGATLLTNLEICFEHLCHIAPYCLVNEIGTLVQNNQIIPLQYSHIITSKTVNISSIGPEGRITQADYLKPGTWIKTRAYSYLDSLPPVNKTFYRSDFSNNYYQYVFPVQTAGYLPEPFITTAIDHNLSILTHEQDAQSMPKIIQLAS